MRRDFGQADEDAQICGADYGGRCPGRGAVGLDPEGSLLMGQGRGWVLADGICRGQFGSAFDSQFRLPQTRLGKKRAEALEQDF